MDAERINFHEEHKRFQDQETAADLRAERIESMAKDMTQPGEEYYPFTPDNLQEAISECELADKLLLGSYAHVAFKQPNDTTKANLADFLLGLSEKYWLDMAKHEAERMIDRG